MAGAILEWRVQSRLPKPKMILVENVASLFSKRAAEKDAEPAFLGSSFCWEI